MQEICIEDDYVVGKYRTLQVGKRSKEICEEVMKITLKL